MMKTTELKNVTIDKDGTLRARFGLYFDGEEIGAHLVIAECGEDLGAVVIRENETLANMKRAPIQQADIDTLNTYATAAWTPALKAEAEARREAQAAKNAAQVQA